VEGVEEILPDNPAFKKALADCVIKAKDDRSVTGSTLHATKRIQSITKIYLG